MMTRFELLYQFSDPDQRWMDTALLSDEAAVRSVFYSFKGDVGVQGEFLLKCPIASLVKLIVADVIHEEGAAYVMSHSAYPLDAVLSVMRGLPIENAMMLLRYLQENDYGDYEALLQRFDLRFSSRDGIMIQELQDSSEILARCSKALESDEIGLEDLRRLVIAAQGDAPGYLEYLKRLSARYFSDEARAFSTKKDAKIILKLSVLFGLLDSVQSHFVRPLHYLSRCLFLTVFMAKNRAQLLAFLQPFSERFVGDVMQMVLQSLELKDRHQREKGQWLKKEIEYLMRDSQLPMGLKCQRRRNLSYTV